MKSQTVGLPRWFRIRLGLGAVGLTLMGALTAACSNSSATSPPSTPTLDFANPDTICDTHQPGCIDYINQLIRESAPTPYPLDPRVKGILLQDPAINAMTGSRQESVDYWLDFTSIHDGWYGDEGAVVLLVFPNSVSYEGQITVASQPCKGHIEDEELINPSDPCVNEPREFSSRTVQIQNSREVYAQVDVVKGIVFNIHDNGGSQQDWEIQGIISRLKSETPQPVTLTPRP